MTEWEKLQTGQLYNDFDRSLFKRRIAAKRLFRAYNRTDDDEQTERRALMEQPDPYWQARLARRRCEGARGRHNRRRHHHRRWQRSHEGYPP